MGKRKRRSFTKGHRAEVIELVRKGGKSIGIIAKGLDLEKPSARACEDAVLSVEIAASHTEGRRNYGSPRILCDLRGGGRKVSRKRVARLMRKQRLVGRRRGRRFVKTTASRHPFPIAANILMREFAVPAANVAWATDITYLWTAEGWLYLAAILDLFSRRAVGFAMGDQITRELPLTTLRRALSHRPDTRDLIHHSDRGSLVREPRLSSGSGGGRNHLQHESPRKLLE